VSLAGDMAVMKVVFFGHLGGKKEEVWNLGGGCTSAMISPACDLKSGLRDKWRSDRGHV
jgi:hypothetical protein